MEEQDGKQRLSEAKAKAASFCAYQERSRQDVAKKLDKLGLTKEECEQVIEELIEDNYLDEYRYAETFVGGKFRVKKWGRIKIRMALIQHGLPEDAIEAGLKVIDPAEYRQTLFELAEKKLALESEEDPLKRKQKLVRYLAGKGYESEEVWAVVNEILN